MKAHLLGTALALASACSGDRASSSVSPPRALRQALASISAEALRTRVDFLASDETEGRSPGSGGHRLARDYLLDELARAGVERGGLDGTSYLHLYPSEGNPRYLYPYPTGHNVVGLLRGSDPELRDQSVVVMAHYDHLGRDTHRQIFNGAYDDTAGVAALLELARAFRASGYAPKRTVVWLFTDEEETGLQGARAFAAHPTVPRDGIVLAISVDPIGRALVPGFAPIALFGLEHSPALRELVERHAPRFTTSPRLIANRRLIHQPFGSDQDRFFEAGIAGVWFVNPAFSFYHQITDEAATVQYDVLLESVRMLGQLVDLVANDTARYPFVAEPPVEARDLAAFRGVAEGLLDPALPLDDQERQSVRSLVERLSRAEAEGPFDLEQREDLLTDMLVQIFALGINHPGPVPPAFPAGATAALR